MKVRPAVWWKSAGRLAAALAAAATIAPALAYAAPMEPVNDDWDYVTAAMAMVGGEQEFREGAPRRGQAFIDTNFFLGSVMQATPAPGKPLDMMQDLRCYDGIAAEPCASSSRVLVSVVLPACSASRSNDCVQGLYVRKDGKVEEATPAGEWEADGTTEFDAVQTTKAPTPASGRLPLFRLASTPHAGGDIYAASVSLDFYMTRSGNAWTPFVADLGAQIMGVSTIGQDMSQEACMNQLANGVGGDAGTCLVTTDRLPNEVFGLKAKVSPIFGSWIFGRVVEPQIQITSSGNQIVLDVEGRPGIVPQSVAVVPVDQVTQDMQAFSPPLPTTGTLLISGKAGQPLSLRTWSAWNAATKSTAASLKRLWLFRSADVSATGLARCLKQGEVGGWISTNAMVYEATPPTYDSATGALDFKIGGPALQPDGSSRVSADYELFLRSEVSTCIWPGQKVANVATVSVLDGAGGEEVTSTSVGEQGGWTKFIARNVLFPNPTSSRARAGAVNPTVRVVVPKAPSAPTFASCPVMWKTYKDGVSYTGAINTVTVKGKKIVKPALGKPFVSDDIYLANAKLDKDKDSLACEREPKVR